MVDRFGASVTEHHLFADDGNVPNHPRWPLIVYRGALKTNGDGASSCVVAIQPKWLDEGLAEWSLFTSSLSQYRP
jgi:hypothetical protein